MRRSSSAAEPREGATIPHGKRDGGSTRPPQVNSAAPTDETRRDDRREEQPLSDEEKLDAVQGEVTSGETDRFLAALREVNGGPPVRVRVDEDGSLVWSGEQKAGEQGFLDDCQVLVDAGIATWLERPA
jgi:hypothetical protein